MSNLAIMLWRGVGVKRDVARAHTLLQQAAEAGYAPAWNGKESVDACYCDLA